MAIPSGSWQLLRGSPRGGDLRRCVNIERRRRNVVDTDLIRCTLKDFEGVVNELPLERQAELPSLILREVKV